MSSVVYSLALKNLGDSLMLTFTVGNITKGPNDRGSAFQTYLGGLKFNIQPLLIYHDVLRRN